MNIVTTVPDGKQLDLDSLPQVLGYTAGVLTTVEVTAQGGTYRQTLTYTDGVLTGISGWVKQ